LKIFRADLHLHTVLSPCAEVEMIPPLIVQEAINRGINLIAITDHNASANVIAVQKAAEGKNLHVLPGMELQTREEVHVLCLFDTLDQILEWQKIVDASLPDMSNRPDFFGEQFVVDETGDFIRREKRMLLTSSSMSFTDAFNQVSILDGIFIPAHVNRQTNGLIANLGMVPVDINIEALEISRHLRISDVSNKLPQIMNYPLIQNGDAHLLADILGVTLLYLEAPTIQEIKKAVHHQDRRFVSIAD
jgi:3',5'-nucleoside bisphosphate phosphatase